MLNALSAQPVEYTEVQIETAKTIAGLLSLSASRSNAINAAQKGESQLAASSHITRSSATESRDSDNGGVPKTLLGKIADQLKQFFEFDVIVLRVQINGEFTTRESHSTNHVRQYSIPPTSSGEDASEQSIEAGTFKTNPSKFQISELAHDLKTSFEPIAAGQDHNLDVTAPDERQFATADRELLRQAIINLLSNAS
jgi:hypothetical protein